MRARLDLRYGLAMLGVFALYVAGGKLGLQLAVVHASATAVWPPTGIAIAAVLVLGPRVWPAIAAGAFVVNVTTAGGPIASLGIATGNTLEALVAGYLVRRFANGRRAFEHVATVFRFALLAALAATTVSATIGVTTLFVTGNAGAADLWAIWWTWWLGDAGGALIVAPFLVLWATLPAVRGRVDVAEMTALATLVVASILVVFSPVSPFAAARAPIAYLTFPALAWAAFRFGTRGAATVALALSAAAVVGVMNGVGPWFAAEQNATFLLLLGFMGTASVTALGLAAAVRERQRAEQALRATEERLRVAEERKVAARDEFLAVAAHELRTPLAALRLAAEALVREIADGKDLSRERVRALSDVAADRSTRLAELVGHLLDTVRVQSGRMDLLVLSDQDVGSLAERVAGETRSRTTRHRIEVRAPSPVTASVDPLRVEQVLRNLLDNAVKYSPGGHIDVDVARRDGAVEIRVSDQGPGIVPEHRERIFDRFYQARGDSSDGLGLGLHLSRHIVELHGGTIAAEFPDEGGTRIVVRLPLRGTSATELEGVSS